VDELELVLECEEASPKRLVLVSILLEPAVGEKLRFLGFFGEVLRRFGLDFVGILGDCGCCRYLDIQLTIDPDSTRFCQNFHLDPSKMTDSESKIGLYSRDQT
jgi:hypothetical protein